jgi:hypothetical protein
VAARKLHTKFATFAVARPLTEYKLLARPKSERKILTPRRYCSLNLEQSSPFLRKKSVAQARLFS